MKYGALSRLHYIRAASGHPYLSGPRTILNRAYVPRMRANTHRNIKCTCCPPPPDPSPSRCSCTPALASTTLTPSLGAINGAAVAARRLLFVCALEKGRFRRRLESEAIKRAPTPPAIYSPQLIEKGVVVYVCPHLSATTSP